MSPKTTVRVSTLLVGSVLALQPAFGQARGGAGTTTGTSGAGSTTTSTTGTTTTKNPGIPSPTTTTPQQSPSMPQPIFISGQVLIDDGTAPPTGIVIEKVCGAQTHSQGYTDAKGYFMIELDQQNSGI